MKRAEREQIRPKGEERWTPGEVVGFCPIHREEFYVPHGGKCPAEHFEDAPDLIEYVPLARLQEVEQELAEQKRINEFDISVALAEANEQTRQAEHLAHSQAQEIERLREALRPYAADRCDKFPKEQQPCEWNCQRIRADHRENAAEYTDESNERAEVLCRSCRVREALGGRR